MPHFDAGFSIPLATHCLLACGFDVLQVNKTAVVCLVTICICASPLPHPRLTCVSPLPHLCLIYEFVSLPFLAPFPIHMREARYGKVCMYLYALSHIRKKVRLAIVYIRRIATVSFLLNMRHRILPGFGGPGKVLTFSSSYVTWLLSFIAPQTLVSLLLTCFFLLHTHHFWGILNPHSRNCIHQNRLCLSLRQAMSNTASRTGLIGDHPWMLCTLITFSKIRSGLIENEAIILGLQFLVSQRTASVLSYLVAMALTLVGPRLWILLKAFFSRALTY